MYRPFQLALCLALATGACAATAQQVQGSLGTIKVDARKNPGDVPYYFFWVGQKQLSSYLPSEPRVLDMSYRITFTEMPDAERDSYLPRSWGVSVVSKSLDKDIAVRRGGYFTLDYLPAAIEENATIMFKEQTRYRAIGVSWVVRVGPDQRLAYADFRKAMRELQVVQNMIGIGIEGLRTVKYAQYDGIKACFLEPGGAIRIDGVSVAQAQLGNCLFLKYDGTLARSGKTIEFAGPLDIVTMVDTRL